jgi:hypothetical protein
VISLSWRASRGCRREGKSRSRCREATEDLTDDLSEGEKGDTLSELAPVETSKKKFQRNVSDLTVWSDENKEKKFYIVLIRSDTNHTVTHCLIQSFDIALKFL